VRRVLRALWRLLVTAGFLGLLCVSAYLWLDRAEERQLRRHAAASERLVHDAARAACATVAQVEAAAAAQGWRTERLATPAGDSLYDPSLPVSLHVCLEPPLPFGKLPYAILQFDAEGCLGPR